MPHPSTALTHLSSLLRRCATAASLRPGQQAHLRALVSGLVPHPTLETDILLMYARCGRLQLARQMFDQMPDRPLHSWNILISSYAQSSLFHYALNLLPPLLASGIFPDGFTLPSLLKSSAGINYCLAGAALHALAITLGLNIHLVVGGSIADMYMKCGSLRDAGKQFDEMPERDGLVWNVMVTGFIKAGLFAEALSLFRRSQFEAVDADWMAVPSVLSACSQTGDWRRGKEVHGREIRLLVSDSDVAIGNSLIDMYSKCGCLDTSRRVFARMRVRNLVTWSVMISCYAFHTQGKEALKYFGKMRAQGLEPNSIIFTSLLSSCSHSGLVEDGRVIFDSISRVYGFEPSMEHYACMVDILGRHGKIEEALGFIEKMAVEPVASIWGALLAACAAHQNVEVGEIAARELFELEPDNPSNYVGLCGIYEKAGNWNDVAEMRRKMKALGMVKTPGCSWIDVEGRKIGFYQGDASCPSSRRMMQVFRGLLGYCKQKEWRCKKTPFYSFIIILMAKLGAFYISTSCCYVKNKFGLLDFFFFKALLMPSSASPASSSIPLASTSCFSLIRVCRLLLSFKCCSALLILILSHNAELQPVSYTKASRGSDLVNISVRCLVV